MRRVSGAVEVRFLGPGDRDLLGRAAPGVFDRGVDDALALEFLADPRHHLVVALEGGVPVAFVSAVHYVHPDKPAELWINEVGVAPGQRRRGLAAKLLRAMVAHGGGLGCREAWVLTDRENPVAMVLYRSCGGTEPPRAPVVFHFRCNGGGNAPGTGSPRSRDAQGMTVRLAEPGDAAAWERMRQALWPSPAGEHAGEIARFFAGHRPNSEETLLAEDSGGRAVGFAELSIRSHAEGCSGRVAYLEGWYVDPEARGSGAGRALVEAAEAWGRGQGCAELASDTEIRNAGSAGAHRAVGFEEIDRVVCFRKSL